MYDKDPLFSRKLSLPNGLPFNEGGFRFDQKMEPGVLPYSGGFGDAATFTDITKDFVLFSHGALVLYGGLPFDPLLQFYAGNNSSERPSAVFSERPIFVNLHNDSEPFFNHVLFAVPKTTWYSLALHFGSIAISDKRTKSYFNVIIQDIKIPDLPALSKMSSVPKHVPMVDVSLVALDGNKVCLHFVPGRCVLTECIRFVKSSPRPSTVEFANRYFDSDEDKAPELKRDPVEKPNVS